MNRRIRSTFGVVAVACLVTPMTTAQAQGAASAKGDDMIPRELALALFEGFGPMFGKIEVTNGALAPQLARRLTMPPGSTIVGSLTTEIMSIAIVRSPLTPDSALAVTHRALGQAGWQQAPSPAQTGGGFVPAVDPSQRSESWCATDRTALAVTAARKPGGTTLNYMVVAPAAGGCDPARYERQKAMVPLPTLFDPEDAERMASECVNRVGGSGSNSGGNVLRTALSPTQLMAHYTKQLADSGWAPANGTANAIAATFVKGTGKPDDRSTRLTLTIMVPPGQPSCRVVEIDSRTRY